MSPGRRPLSRDDRGQSNALASVESTLEGISWYPIAKKELLDTVRSRALWIISALFLGVYVVPLAVVLYTDLGPAAQAISGLIVLGTNMLSTILVPLAGIAIAFTAISGERQSGSLKLLLSLPYDRREVLVGKLVGRTVVVLLPLVIALLLRVAMIVPESNGELSATAIAAATVLPLVLAAVFVSLALGFSAVTRTTTRSVLASIGTYVYLALFWNSFANGAGSLLKYAFDVSDVTELKAILFVKLLNPIDAFSTLLTSLLGTPEPQARVQMFGGLISLGQGGLQARMRQQLLLEEFGGSVPIYFSDLMPALTLLVWLVVPVAVGYYVFERSDL